jgi:hypothetical protein
MDAGWDVIWGGKEVERWRVRRKIGPSALFNSSSFRLNSYDMKVG